MRFEELNELFVYNPISGELRWRWRDPAKLYHGDSWNKKFAGKIAGTLSKGYRVVIVSSVNQQVSRIAWALYYRLDLDAVPPIVDHKDRITDNNRIRNLRAADYFNNNHNEGMKKNNKSGVKGVSISTKNKSHPYRAHIMAYGKQYEKSFKTMDEAASWREQQVINLHGEFGLSVRKEVDCVKI